MQNYQKLQDLYTLPEISKQCVDINFAYAFICAMASSELDLEQWMPLLFGDEQGQFSTEKLATNFAQTVLSIHAQTVSCFRDGAPLSISSINTGNDQYAMVNFAKGYLQALMMLDNMQETQFESESVAENLQQTCLLLLDKVATGDTPDEHKQVLFEQLPSTAEIIAILPNLLSSFGHHCLMRASH